MIQRMCVGLLCAASVWLASCANDLARVETGALTVDPGQITFSLPAPGASSVEAALSLTNTGGAGVLFNAVTLREDDAVVEVALLDADDWNSGSRTLGVDETQTLRLSWNVLDAQRDSGVLVLDTNAGIIEVPFETLDIDPFMEVETLPIGESQPPSGLRVALAPTPQGQSSDAAIILTSASIAPLTLEDICLLDGSGACLDDNRTADGAFLLCAGAPATAEMCTNPSRDEPLAQGETFRLKVFYTPQEGAVDRQVSRVRIRSNAGQIPDFTVTIQAEPCLDCAACEDAGMMLGTSCGVCDTGTLICADSGDVECDGDQGEDALNACGGCEALVGEVDASCGTCGTGTIVCDGTDATACEGDAGDEALNACGGCDALEGVPGDVCGSCQSGILVCDGEDATVCEGDVGDEALNVCGGCDAIEGDVGDLCGTCDSGALACDGTDAMVCEGDLGPGALNACLGCDQLVDVPGDDCGTCGSGTTVCDGTDATVCEGDLGPGALNACNGCAVLPFELDGACGVCPEGRYVCDGADALVCAGCEDLPRCTDIDGGVQCDAHGEFFVEIPPGVNEVSARAWGGGGYGSSHGNGTGGGGGYVLGRFQTTPGETIKVRVASGATALSGGGAASYVLRGDGVLIVAAGGGGGGADGCSGCFGGGAGGAGGGEAGQAGEVGSTNDSGFGQGTGGTGGTQVAGGQGGVSDNGGRGSTCISEGADGGANTGGQGGGGGPSCTNGGRGAVGFEIPVRSNASNGSGGGGGAGYFGGGGGGGRYTYFGGGGGGGSSFAAPEVLATLVGGDRRICGGQDDLYYLPGAALGGQRNEQGGDGLVVIIWE